jgi:hypothetical protein
MRRTKQILRDNWQQFRTGERTKIPICMVITFFLRPFQVSEIMLTINNLATVEDCNGTGYTKPDTQLCIRFM